MRRFTTSSLGRYVPAQLAYAPATRLLGSRPAQVARAAAVLSFGTAAVTAHCVGSAWPQEDLAKKLQEIEEMKRAIEQREREHALEQRAHGEGDFDDDRGEGDFDDDRGDDDFGGGSSDVQEIEQDDECDDILLRVGEPAKHDLLGNGTVLAIGATMEVSAGVLQDGATFESLDLPMNKVLFKFTKREKVPGSRSTYKDVEKRRQVFADALTPLAPEAADDQDADSDAFDPTAFDAMAWAARRGQKHAFTHGLSGPELAAHERKRKVSHLKDAPVRGHNKEGRKTKEPNVSPQVYSPPRPTPPCPTHTHTLTYCPTRRSFASMHSQTKAYAFPMASCSVLHAGPSVLFV